MRTQVLDQGKWRKMLTFHADFCFDTSRCSADFFASFSFPSYLTMSELHVCAYIWVYICVGVCVWGGGEYYGHHHGLDLILNCGFPLPAMIIIIIIILFLIFHLDQNGNSAHFVL
jgi:hypothetical protein